MTTGRRRFLKLAALAGAAETYPVRALASATAAPPDVPEAKLAQDPERPEFHLMPARNWMNDPNGPIFLNGQYHMFFQHNPFGPLWGNMSWGHAVSPDMLHWRHLAVALRPTPGGADAYGVFSGSAIRVDHRVYMVYTATVRSDAASATIKQDSVRESQSLAWSDDPDLVRWTKQEQPILPTPPAGLRVTGFRDPSAWQQGDTFYMTVGSGIEGVGGCVLLYRSRDMHHWDYLHPLIVGKWTGKPAANPCDNGEMWECPDFFPLDGAHVLIYSTMGKVFWQSGHFDPHSLTFTPAKSGVLDVGSAYYAPKTQLDANNRRILWGWIQEKRSDDAIRVAGWAGAMSLPRVLHLRPDGTLGMDVIPETAKLRGAAFEPTNNQGTLEFVLPACSGELLCSADPNAAFHFSLQQQGSDLLTLSLDPSTRSLLLDGKELATANDGPLSLHLFVDASVLELIVNQSASCTRRFYFAGPKAPDVTVRLSGAHLQATAWKVAPISPDRLTGA